MTETPTPFAIRLQRAMTELNISRVTLARELGVDKSVIARWIGGVNQPTSHNLTRLTEVLRRRRPELTLDFWRSPEPVSLRLPGPPEAAPACASSGLVLAGLRLPRRPDIDANYAGLWAGFYQSTQNRGAVVLCLMLIAQDRNGLRCVFTEGKVSAAGTGVAIGPRLHGILEIDPLHDRLCLFIFNGVGTPDAAVMDGLYAISAGDASTCATASPIVLFRIGMAEDFDRLGGLARIMPGLSRVNLAAIPRSVAAGDPVAGLTDLFPEEVLRLLCAAVGTKRADGSVDHVLRMPAARSLPSGAFGVAELPPCSPIIRTRSALREVLGLG
ncbi:MAG: hypothetical protein BGO51_04700 [Rhodospirillales bacterium 69-11]|nr:helix-turn-helix transcriptional regulator [Rhodospirillales bacterium]OJW23138.1 MAG: hypothetical protein BGO51_04700 [Rhodospirillales bacterium 69-11]